MTWPNPVSAEVLEARDEEDRAAWRASLAEQPAAVAPPAGSSWLDRARHQIHVRKAHREHQRRLHHPRRVHREMRAIQKLRAQVSRFQRLPRVMFDDTTVELIPKAARAIGAYTNGNYENVSRVRQLFPKAKVVAISVVSSGRGSKAECLDVEPGDATNADVARWYRSVEHPGFMPVFYTSASNAGALEAALAAEGIGRHQYRLWSAHYDGSRHVCGPATCGYPQADATQWTSTSHSRSLDESKVKPRFWRRRHG